MSSWLRLFAIFACLLSSVACAQLTELKDRLTGPAEQSQEQNQPVHVDPPTNAAPAESSRPCQEELQRVCATVTPGRDAIRRCIAERQSQLSERCKALFQQRQTR